MTNKLKLSLLLFLFFSSINSQIKFEKGYFITNDNQKVECLIRNSDWEVTPSKIIYKLTEESEKITLSSNEIKEFSIQDKVKYSRFIVEVDQSTEDIGNLSHFRNPEFKQENVLLKHIVEGKANLYLYSEINSIKFFYSKDSSKIQQLIYKKYHSKGDESIISYNNYYKMQLFNDLNCSLKNIKENDNIEYDLKNLEKYFRAYNNCSLGGKNNTNEIRLSNNKGKFHLYADFRLTNYNFSVENVDSRNTTLKFDSKSSISFGAELEYVFGFFKNKWSVFLNPTYGKYKSSTNYEYSTTFGTKNETINSEISIIEIPIGVRYYSFLNDNSKIFLDGGIYNVIQDVDNLISVNNSSFASNNNEFKEIYSSIFVGAGFVYKKYSLAFRYYNQVDIDDYINKESPFKKISFILKYQIF